MAGFVDPFEPDPLTGFMGAPRTALPEDRTSSIPGVPQEYLPHIDRASKIYGVSPHHIAATMRAESNFNPRAVSPTGAQGLMQLMPGTAREMGVDDPFDPVQNIMGGARYLRQMLDATGGDPHNASLAYHDGPTAWKNGRHSAEGLSYAQRVAQYLNTLQGGDQVPFPSPRQGVIPTAAPQQDADPIEQINAQLKAGGGAGATQGLPQGIDLDPIEQINASLRQPGQAAPFQAAGTGISSGRQFPLVPVAQPEQPIPYAEARGPLGSLASGLAQSGAGLISQAGSVLKGAARIALPESLEKPVMEYVEPVGTAIQKFGGETLARNFEIFRPQKPQDGPISYINSQIIEKGAANLLPSLAPAAVGFLLGGFGGAAIALGATFFPSAFNDAYEKGIKSGLSHDDAHWHGIRMGTWETTSELLADFIEARTLGVGKVFTQPLKASLKEMMKTPIKTWAGRTGAVGAIETISEMGNAALQAYDEQMSGIRNPADPWEAAKEAIGPSIGLSILMGGLVAGANKVQQKGIFKDLSDPTVDPEQRQNTVNLMAKEMSETPGIDPALAVKWQTVGTKAVQTGQPIPVDSSWVDFAQEKTPPPPPGGTGTTTPTQKKAPTTVTGQTEPVETTTAPVEGTTPAPEDWRAQRIQNWATGQPRPWDYTTGEGFADPNPTKNEFSHRLTAVNAHDPQGMNGKPVETWTHKRLVEDNKMPSKAGPYAKKLFRELQGISEPGVSFKIVKINGKETVHQIQFNKQYFDEAKAAAWYTKNAAKLGRTIPGQETAVRQPLKPETPPVKAPAPELLSPVERLPAEAQDVLAKLIAASGGAKAVFSNTFTDEALHFAGVTQDFNSLIQKNVLVKQPDGGYILNKKTYGDVIAEESKPPYEKLSPGAKLVFDKMQQSGLLQRFFAGTLHQMDFRKQFTRNEQDLIFKSGVIKSEGYFDKPNPDVFGAVMAETTAAPEAQKGPTPPVQTGTPPPIQTEGAGATPSTPQPSAPPPGKAPTGPAVRKSPRYQVQPTDDLVDIVRKKGGLKADDPSVDVKWFKESGTRTGSNLIAKKAKWTIDEILPEILEDAGMPANTSVDDFMEELKRHVEARIAEKQQGIPSPYKQGKKKISTEEAEAERLANEHAQRMAEEEMAGEEGAGEEVPFHIERIRPSTTLSGKTTARIKENLAKGLKVWRGVGQRPSDPGDFGAGTYHSTARARAKEYGDLVQQTVTLRNPLILTNEEAYRNIADKYGTISGIPGEPGRGVGNAERRLENAQRATEDLRSQGYDGIAAVNMKDGEIEVVVFPKPQIGSQASIVREPTRESRLTAAKRTLTKQRNKMPLFADQIAETQETPEERVTRFEKYKEEATKAGREQEAAEWAEVEMFLEKYPEQEVAKWKEEWANKRWKGEGAVYYAGFMHDKAKAYEGFTGSSLVWYKANINPEARLFPQNVREYIDLTGEVPPEADEFRKRGLLDANYRIVKREKAVQPTLFGADSTTADIEDAMTQAQMDGDVPKYIEYLDQNRYRKEPADGYAFEIETPEGTRKVGKVKATYGAPPIQELWFRQANDTYAGEPRLGTIGVREAFQNALDAVIMAMKRGQIKEGKINLWMENYGSTSFTIEDNGVGMSDTDIQENFLMIFGTGKAKEGLFGSKGTGKAVILAPSIDSTWELHTRDNYFNSALAQKGLDDPMNPEEIRQAALRQGTRVTVKDETGKTIVSSERAKAFVETTKPPKGINIYINDQLVKYAFEGKKAKLVKEKISDHLSYELRYYPESQTPSDYQNKHILRIVEPKSGACLTQAVKSIWSDGFSGCIVQDIITDVPANHPDYPLTNSRMEVKGDEKFNKTHQELITKYSVDKASAKRAVVESTTKKIGAVKQWKAVAKKIATMNADSYNNLLATAESVYMSDPDRAATNPVFFTPFDELEAEVDTEYKGNYGAGSTTEALFNANLVTGLEVVARMYSYALNFPIKNFLMKFSQDVDGGVVRASYGRDTLTFNPEGINPLNFQNSLRLAMYLKGLVDHELTHFYVNPHNEQFSSYREETHRNTADLWNETVMIAKAIMGEKPTADAAAVPQYADITAMMGVMQPKKGKQKQESGDLFASVEGVSYGTDSKPDYLKPQPRADVLRGDIGRTGEAGREGYGRIGEQYGGETLREIGEEGLGAGGAILQRERGTGGTRGTGRAGGGEPAAAIERTRPKGYTADEQSFWDRARERFGITRDPHEAGWILPTGEMLDFTGRHQAVGYENRKPIPGQPDYLKGNRNVDHREIQDILEPDPDMPAWGEGGEYNTPLREFAYKAGGVRVHIGRTGFSYVQLWSGQKVSPQQWAALEKIVADRRGGLEFDILDRNGRSIAMPTRRDYEGGGADIGKVRRLFATIGGDRIGSQAQLKAPTWYNPLVQVIEDKIRSNPDKPISRDMFRAILKQPGIKPEFVRWSGIEDLLASKEKLSKREVIDYLEINAAPWQEVTFKEHLPEGAWKEFDAITDAAGDIQENLHNRIDSALQDELRDHPELRESPEEILDADGEARTRRLIFSALTEKLNDSYVSYRLINDAIPHITRPVVAKIIKQLRTDAKFMAQATEYNDLRIRAREIRRSVQQGEGQKPRYEDWTTKGPRQDYQEHFVTAPPTPGAYQIVEVQRPTEERAGWNSTQTVEGFKIGKIIAKFNTAEERNEAWRAMTPQEKEGLGWDYRGEEWDDGHPGYEKVKNPIVRIRWSQREAQEPGKPVHKRLHIEEMQPPKNFESKLPAILLANWYKIGIRKALKHAVENGYDSISLTLGTEQTKRYGLSQVIDSIEAYPGHNKDWIRIDMGRRANEFLYNRLSSEQVRAPDRGTGYEVRKDYLPEIIGKDLSIKVIEDTESRGYSVVSGEGLEVGGEGVKKIYDEMLLPAFNEIGKKYLARMNYDPKGVVQKTAEEKKYNGPEIPYWTVREAWSLANVNNMARLEEDLYQIMYNMKEHHLTFKEAMEKKGTYRAAMNLGVANHFTISDKAEYTPAYVMPINDRMRESLIDKPIPMLSPQTEFNFSEGITVEEINNIVNDVLRIAPVGTTVETEGSIFVDAERIKDSIEKWNASGILTVDTSRPIQVGGLTAWYPVGNDQIAAAIRLAYLHKNLQMVSETTFGRSAMHEAFHAIHAVLDRKDIALLKKHFGDNYEKVANAFADYVYTQKATNKEVKSVWEKVMQYLEKLHNLLTGRGFQRPEDIFQRAYQGKYAGRTPHYGSYARAYASVTMPEGVKSFEQDAMGEPHYGNPAVFDQAQIRFDDKDFNPLLHPYKAIKKEYQNRFTLGLNDPDMKKFARYFSNPHWLAKQYYKAKENFRRVLEVELTREENRERTFLEFLRKTTIGRNEDWQMHEFMQLPFEQAEKITKAALDSTVKNEVFKDDVLRDTYKLTPSEIAVYHGIKTSFDKGYDTLLRNLEDLAYRPYQNKWWFKDLVSVLKGDPQLDMYGTAKRDKDGNIILVKKPVLEVSSLMEPKDWKEFQRAMNNIEPYQKTLESLRKEMGRVKYYFPLVRPDGDYYVRVWKMGKTKKGEEKEILVASYRSATEYDARKNHDKAKAEYPNARIEYGLEKRLPETFYQQISDVHTEKFIERAIDKLRNKKYISEEEENDLRESILEVLVDDLKARGFGRHMISRYKPDEKMAIKGYQETKGQQMFYDYMSGLAGFITKMNASFDFNEALKGIDSETRPELFDYSTTYVRDMMRNQTEADRLSGKARSVAFLWFLAGSLRAGAIQGTQNFVTGMPYLHRMMRRMGVEGSAELAYTKAMKDIVGKKLGHDQLTTEEKQALQEAINRGETSDQYMREVTGRMRGKYGERMDKLTTWLATPFRGMEIFNRKSAFIAAYRVARKAGLNHDEAIVKGIDFIHDTHYLMGKANLPEMARQPGGLGVGIRTAYTFRSFTHNYVLSLIHSLRREEDGTRHYDVLFRSLAAIAILGGAMALPMLDDLLDDAERLTGTPYRSEIRKALRGIGGKMLESFGMAGLPGLLFDVDISGSLKIGSPTKWFTGFLQGAPMKGFEESVYGVYGGLASKAARALDLLTRGEYLRAIEAGAPVGLENLTKAYRLASEPVQTERGKLQLDEKGKPVRLTGGEIAGQAAGFRPERLSALSQERRSLQNIQAHYQHTRDSLASRLRMADNEKERQAVIEDIRAYNKEVIKYKGAVPFFHKDTAKRATAQKPDKKFIIFEKVYE